MLVAAAVDKVPRVGYTMTVHNSAKVLEMAQQASVVDSCWCCIHK